MGIIVQACHQIDLFLTAFMKTSNLLNFFRKNGVDTLGHPESAFDNEKSASMSMFGFIYSRDLILK